MPRGNKKPENTERCFSLADYSASDFIKIDEDSDESKSTKTRLKSEKFRSYTEPDFIAEMWQTRRGPTAKLKSLGEIFQRRKYARFTNKEAEDQGTIHDPLTKTNEPANSSKMHSFHGGMEFGYESTAKTESNPRVKMRTKILTRRSQRPKRGMNEENISESQETFSMFNDLSEIEAWISFAAHVKRQGPGFSASCTQTLRACDFTSVKEFYERKIILRHAFQGTSLSYSAKQQRELGSLSTRVFETRTATGREHFACQDSVVSHIFIPIISNGEKILSNLSVVV